jgi:hypothetical protein
MVKMKFSYLLRADDDVYQLNEKKKMTVENLIGKSALMKLQLSLNVGLNFVIIAKKRDVYIVAKNGFHATASS